MVTVERTRVVTSKERVIEVGDAVCCVECGECSEGDYCRIDEDGVRGPWSSGSVVVLLCATRRVMAVEMTRGLFLDECVV